jgi:nucleotide-binding universal stress UspA family protein
VLLRGDAKSSLVDYANTNQADLVIVGQRGLGWIKRYVEGDGAVMVGQAVSTNMLSGTSVRRLLGSVSDHLSHQLKMPILIVRDST